MSDLAPRRFPQPDRGCRGQAGRRSKGSSECASSQSRRYPPVSCGRCGQRWMNSTLPSRARDVYCRGAVMSLLWPTICEVVKAAHGFICSHCIASALALPGSTHPASSRRRLRSSPRRPGRLLLVATPSEAP